MYDIGKKCVTVAKISAETKAGFPYQNPAFWILTTLTQFCAQLSPTAIVLLKILLKVMALKDLHR